MIHSSDLRKGSSGKSPVLITEYAYRTTSILLTFLCSSQKDGRGWYVAVILSFGCSNTDVLLLSTTLVVWNKGFGVPIPSPKTLRRGHNHMTNGSSAYSDEKRTDGQRNRNKRTNADGIPYKDRDGSWTALDKAVAAFGKFLLTWLIPERIEIELTILNPPDKCGHGVV